MGDAASFTEALAEGLLVFDGAMGTEIYRRHVFVNRSYDELCLSDPDLVREIHADYLAAGADVLITNTFGANRKALAPFLPRYEEFLRLTGSGPVEEVARRGLEVDVSDPAFWTASINSLAAPLERYKELLAKLKS